MNRSYRFFVIFFIALATLPHASACQFDCFFPFWSSCWDTELSEYYSREGAIDEKMARAKAHLIRVQKQMAKEKEHVGESSIRKKPALILDIDGTAIKLVQTQEYEGIIFPIANPDIYKLYRFALKMEIKVIFLTARPASTLSRIQTLLKSLGYQTYEMIIAAPDLVFGRATLLSETKNDQASRKYIGEWKNQMRRRLVEMDKFEIVMTVDDFEENLEGDFTGFKFLIPPHS